MDRPGKAIVVLLDSLNRHMLGFQIRLTGQSPRAARFAGVKPRLLVVFCMGVSGALAGLAGLFEVAGPAGQISIDFNVGYGFTAIIVAMTLIFLTSSLGLLDYNLLWVPPTYLWPGIVGGLIMGVGFIIGGFCPGTSLVAMALLM